MGASIGGVDVTLRTNTRRLVDVFGQAGEAVRTLALRQTTPTASMLRVAAAQFDPVLGDAPHNADRVCSLIEQSANNGARLVVFPEGAVTGYNVADADSARHLALHADAGPLERIVEACAQAGLHAVVGAVRVDPEGRLRNSAFVLGPAGIAAIYDKAHAPLLGADRFIARGDAAFAPIQLPFCTLGVLIGYDLVFPEAARSLALRGADVLAVPSAWQVGGESGVDFLVKARSFENRVFVVAANRVGEERLARYIGRSCIASPVGVHLAEASASEEHIIIADINLNEARQKRTLVHPGEWESDLLADRRPELYDLGGDVDKQP